MSPGSTDAGNTCQRRLQYDGGLISCGEVTEVDSASSGTWQGSVRDSVILSVNGPAADGSLGWTTTLNTEPAATSVTTVSSSTPPPRASWHTTSGGVQF